MYLDTPAFIYYLEHHARYSPAAGDLFSRVREGLLRAHTSVLTLAELLMPLYRIGSTEPAQRLAASLRAYPHLGLLDVGGRAAERAARLRGVYNLHTPDAVHVASALGSGADWLVTNDRRLRRVEGEGIRVWLFDDHTAPAS